MATATTVPQGGYHNEVNPPHDGEVHRDKITRWLVFIVCLVLILGIPTKILSTLGQQLGGVNGFRIGIWVGLAASGAICYQLYSRFLLYVPEWMAYVTQDGFLGTLVIYGPGWHPTYPWEMRNAKGNYSLKVVEQSFAFTIATTTGQVIARISLQYAPDLSRIEGAIGFDHTIITRGYQAFIKEFLTEQLARQTVEYARTNIEKINAELATNFDGGDIVTAFEERFKITTAAVLLEDLDLPEGIQKAQDTVEISIAWHRAVAATLGITPEELSARIKTNVVTAEQFRELLNRVMVGSRQAEMKIHVLEANVPAIIGELFDRLRGTKGGT